MPITDTISVRFGGPVINTWWRHQMETFFALLALCEGDHRSPVDSPDKGQWHGALMFSLISAWTSNWANNRDVGDLRRHRPHYDVTLMNNGVYRFIVKVSHGGKTVFTAFNHPALNKGAGHVICIEEHCEEHCEATIPIVKGTTWRDVTSGVAPALSAISIFKVQNTNINELKLKMPCYNRD